MRPPCLSARAVPAAPAVTAPPGRPAVPARAGRVGSGRPPHARAGATAPGATGGGYPVRAMSALRGVPLARLHRLRVGRRARARFVLPHLVRRVSAIVEPTGVDVTIIDRTAQITTPAPTTPGARRSTDPFPGGRSAAHRADRARKWAQVSALTHRCSTEATSAKESHDADHTGRTGRPPARRW